MPEAVVLVVEDEPGYVTLLSAALESRGYAVVVARTGAEALDATDRFAPDVTILDLGLPDVDGLQVCRHLRRASRNPILVVTADGAEERKVQALTAFITERYGGDASRIWREAKDGRDLQARLLELPGFGEMKVRTVLSVLAKRYGVSLPGLSDVVPGHPTLGDVDSPEALASYQAGKRAYKASMRAQGKRV